MLRICPGYRTADGGEPVARARRVRRRPREQRAEWLNFPEAMLRICPGYRTADGGEPVARARRVRRRPREQRAEWLNFPEAMLRICPGYRTADGGEPVARARRVRRRPREQRAEWLNFPEAMLRICPGYGTADGSEPTNQAVGALFASNKKSPIKGLDIAVCLLCGGSQTSRRQATCPAAPSATIRLFRQLGGHMNLVTGIRFGNVVRLALVFSNGGDFGFGVVQRISGYANRLSEASERDQRQHTGSGK